MSDLVLVTGGSGFVAAHVIVQLLESGYRVRATVRSAGRVTVVREMLRQGGVADPDAVTFVEADLLSDEGWTAACEGCRWRRRWSPARVPRTSNGRLWAEPSAC